MSTLYKGNQIGTSKKQGILSTYEKEGSDMKLLQFGTFLRGSEPFIVKDINTSEPVDRDAWVRMYVNNPSIAAKKRIEDTARITKFVASPRGILWEADMAALETIQKSYNQKHQQKIDNIRQLSQVTDGSDFWKSLGKNLTNNIVNLAKSALRGIGLTAATLTQVAASGTGYHGDTYISRAYLTDGGNSSVLNTILSYAGWTKGGGVNGAAAVLGGATDILGSEPWKKVPDSSKLVSEDSTEGREGETTPELFYGTKPRGRIAPRDYKGERLGSRKYGAFDLHGVTRTTKTSETQRGPSSLTVEADRIGLEEEQFGRYGDITDLSSQINSESFATSKREATRVAKHYGESEENRYVKDTSVGLGKEGEIPYKVELSGRDEKLVKTLYNVETADPDNYGYAYDKDYKYVSDSSWPFKKDPKVVTVTVPKKPGKTVDNKLSTKERIWTLNYGSKLPIYNWDADDDLTFDEFFMEPDLGLIPFCITTITPDHRTYLNFPAYLDSYDDDYRGDWDSVQYIGRAEKFYGYKGFTRSINLSFKVLARNEQQVEPLYRNLNRLVGGTAPSYGPEGVFMRGTLASLTIGGNQEGALLRDQLGFIPSVKLAWEVNYPWEIGWKDGEEYKIGGIKFVVPMVLNVSMQFTPIEKQEVREDYEAYFVFDPEQRSTAPRSVPLIPEPDEEDQRIQFPEEEQKVFQRDNTGAYGNSPGGYGGYGGGLTVDQVAQRNQGSIIQEPDMRSRIQASLGKGGITNPDASEVIGTVSGGVKRGGVR